MSGFLPVDSLDSPRFVGLPTFMRLPLAQPGDALDVAIIGVPCDSGSPYRTGSRLGPNAVRQMSVMLRPISPYRDHISVFETLRVADAGDANVVPGYLMESLEKIEESLSSLVDLGIIPLAIGGDHSIALPAIRSVARKHGPVSLVHFDSHADTWNSYFGGKEHSAGTPFRRGVEERLIDPATSIQIGMRGSLFRADDVSQSLDLGYDVVTTDETLALGPEKLAERIAARVGDNPVYITYDLDFVDPAFAPGVGTPEAGGPTSREALAILRAMKPMNIVGCDVVETNPTFDGPGQITALLGATVALELLTLIAAGRSA
ncbi:MAG: agmatinase [Thalassobaculaceae bacterium]|nr:agmatinase [Thalassobaculaceae bacterium]